MMASPHDGEVVTAARTATKFLAAGGTTWNEILKPQPMESQDEILSEKLLALKSSNDRLRIENHKLRARLHQPNNSPYSAENRPLNAFALWLLFLLVLGCVIYAMS